MYGGLLQWCKGEFIVEAFKVFSDTSFKEAEQSLNRKKNFWFVIFIRLINCLVFSGKNLPEFGAKQYRYMKYGEICVIGFFLLDIYFFSNKTRRVQQQEEYYLMTSTRVAATLQSSIVPILTSSSCTYLLHQQGCLGSEKIAFTSLNIPQSNIFQFSSAMWVQKFQVRFLTHSARLYHHHPYRLWGSPNKSTILIPKLYTVQLLLTKWNNIDSSSL